MVPPACAACRRYRAKGLDIALNNDHAGTSPMATADPAPDDDAQGHSVVAADGGVCHEAIWSDHGARRAAGHVRMGADGFSGPGWPGHKWQLTVRAPFTVPKSFWGSRSG